MAVLAFVPAPKILNTGAGQAVPAAVSVTTSSTEILAANTARKWCFLTNIGNKDVWIAIGQTAVGSRGLLLRKQGGSLALTAQLMSTEAINGITSAGTGSMIVQEGQ